MIQSGREGRLVKTHGIDSDTTLCAFYQGHCFDWTVANMQSQPKYLRSTQIVVARFREDIRWLDALSDIPTVVYDRGGSSELLPSKRSNLHFVQQPNTGREDEVWLRHIIEHYDNGLAETTVFLQGWPFLHCPGAVETVNQIAVAAEHGSHLMHSEGLVPISRTFYQYNVSAGLVGYELTGAGIASQKEFGTQLFQRLCSKLLGGECPSTQWVAEGAQWAVRRERILAHPKQFYEQMLAIPEDYHAKTRGLVLEALWPILWSAEAWSPMQSNTALEVTDTHLDGLTQQRMRSADGHCQDPQGFNEGLMWSCEDKMGACEMELKRTWKQQNRNHSDKMRILERRQAFFVDHEFPANGSK